MKRLGLVMENKAKKPEITITTGEPDKPYAKIILQDRRFSLKDRRMLPTYLANDRRAGIEDRRKNGRGKQ
jgi:hypothetical protein